jgi:hypothetical protein
LKDAAEWRQAGLQQLWVCIFNRGHGELILKSISKATTGKQSTFIYEKQTREP